MKLILFAIALGLPAFSHAKIKIVKNQSLIDGVLRSSNGTVSCRNGSTVTIQRNTAVMNNEVFNWQAFATPDSSTTGSLLLNLYPRNATNLNYWQTHVICTFAEFPAIYANIHPPVKRRAVGECNPWVNCP